MGKSNGEDYTNMVWLAGTVQQIKINEDNGFFLIDVTGTKEGPTKWIPCTVYKEPELLKRLESYGKGDAIKIRGFVRAWSQKKDGEWKNAVDIRVTEIKSEDPKRQTRQKAAESFGREDYVSRGTPKPPSRASGRTREPGDDDEPPMPF